MIFECCVGVCACECECVYVCPVYINRGDILGVNEKAERGEKQTSAKAHTREENNDQEESRVPW